MRIVVAVAALSLSLGLVSAEEDAKPPFPEGKSVQRFEDLTFHVEIPVEYDAKKEYSLIVGLHGAGAAAGEFATWLEPLIEKGFIVVCPKSTGPACWSGLRRHRPPRSKISHFRLARTCASKILDWYSLHCRGIA